MQRTAGVLANLALMMVSAHHCGAASDAHKGAPSSSSPSLALSPAVITVKAQPGLSSTNSLTLTNLTSNKFEFALEAFDVVVQDGKRVFVPAGETEGGIARSAVFNSKTLELSPGQSGTVSVTLTIPPDPSVRAVVAVFHGQTLLHAGAVMFTGSLGALITFSLSDKVSLHAAVAAVNPQTENANLTIDQELQNDGSEPVVPQGTLAILKTSGELVAKVPIEPHRLLPGEKFKYAIECSHTLRPGKYRGLVSFAYEGRVQTTSVDFEVVE
jgi:methionine-rich copper-binding protein CopC